jgi:hypothetical protein
MSHFYGAEQRSDSFVFIRSKLVAAADDLTLNFEGNPDEQSHSYTASMQADGAQLMYGSASRRSPDNTEVGIQTFDYLERPQNPNQQYRVDFSWAEENRFFFGRVFLNGKVEFDSTDAPGGLLETKDGLGYAGRLVEFSEVDPDFVRERDVFTIEDVARALMQAAAFIRGEQPS